MTPNNPEIQQTEAEPTNAIGMNLASFLPLTVVEWEVKRISDALHEQRYEFLSAFPSRSFKYMEGLGLALPVWYVERAWNPTQRSGLMGFLEVLERKPESPKIHDWVAFPDKATSDEIFQRFPKLYKDPKIRAVVHDFEIVRGFDSTAILEVHPGLNKSPNELADMVSNYKHLGGVDIDTKHIRRQKRPDELSKVKSYPNQPVGSASSLGNWLGTMDTFLAARQVELVDFQSKDVDEMRRTLKGEQTELDEMVAALLEGGFKGPIRVEFNMGLINQVKPGYSLSIAKEALEYLREKINS